MSPVYEKSAILQNGKIFLFANFCLIYHISPVKSTVMTLCYPPDTHKESTPSRASPQVAALFQPSSRNRVEGFPHDEFKSFMMSLCFPTEASHQLIDSRVVPQKPSLFQPSSRNREYLDGFPHDEVKSFLDTYFPHDEDFCIIFIQSAQWLYQEYQKLDRTHGTRRDGSTHWSHAWETTQILVRDFWVRDIPSVLACLKHDAIEDIDMPKHPKMNEATLIQRQTQKLLCDILAPFWPDIASKSLAQILELTKLPLSIHKDRTGIRPRAAREKDAKARIDQEYNERLKSMDILTFLIKCADRYHALTHFHQNPIKKVRSKVKETNQYIFSEIEQRLKRKSIKKSPYYESLENAYVLIMEQMHIVHATCVLLKQKRNESYDISTEKEARWYLNPKDKFS
jgi:HD domain